MVGDRTMSRTVETVPTTMLHARRGREPFQNIDSSSAGKFALAAIAKASPTMKATFCPLNTMPSTIATSASTTVASRATRSCSRLVGLARRGPRGPTDRATSAAAPDSVRPATTARIVANATAEMKPRNAVPPDASASSGAAMLPPLSTALIASRPTSTDRAEAEDERDEVEEADEAGRVDDRACAPSARRAPCRSASGCAAVPRCRTSARGRARSRRADW